MIVPQNPELLIAAFLFLLVGIIAWRAANRLDEAKYQTDLARYKNVAISPDWCTVGELPEDEQRLAVASLRRLEKVDPDYVKRWSKDEIE